MFNANRMNSSETKHESFEQEKLDAGESNDTQVQYLWFKTKVEHKFILSHNQVLTGYVVIWFSFFSCIEKEKVTKKHKPEYLKVLNLQFMWRIKQLDWL